MLRARLSVRVQNSLSSPTTNRRSPWGFFVKGCLARRCDKMLGVDGEHFFGIGVLAGNGAVDHAIFKERDEVAILGESKETGLIEPGQVARVRKSNELRH